jgi:type VI protein secretion system component Hcp
MAEIERVRHVSNNIIVLTFAGTYKIEGQSKRVPKGIDCHTMTHAISMPMASDKSSNTRTAGVPIIGDIQFTARLSNAYPLLARACVNGTNCGDVGAILGKISESKFVPVLEIKMKNVYISSIILLPEDVNLAENIQGEGVQYRFSLNMSSIQYMYTTYDEGGKSGGKADSNELTALGGGK